MITSELELLMMKEMCITAAASLKLQCSREYWDEEGDKRATAIHELSREVQKNLPTENLVTERYLAHFGALASQSAKHSNRLFKAKRIRDDLTLFTEEDPQYDNKKAYYKILDEMERSWTEKQKQALKLKIQDSMLKKQRANDFIDVILKKCKEHGGPVTSISELNQLCLKYNDNDIKKYLRQEIQYQNAAHRRDSQERPGLYKINNLTSEELTEQMALLLATDEQDSGILFHTEEEIVDIILDRHSSNRNELSTSHDITVTVTGKSYEYQQPLAVVWDQGAGRTWYVGFFIDENDDGTIRVDHLVQQGEDQSVWIRPRHDDIQDVRYIQIIPCSLTGGWEVTRRSAVFKLKNATEINMVFQQLFN